ncbi:hypothetical protein GC194_00085 [bacterium]|nr:hypothetical protein [bacterium]
MEGGKHKWYKWFCTWYPALYLLFSIVLVQWHALPGFGVDVDLLYYYVREARAIQQGHFLFDIFHGPVYPMLLALVESVVGDFFISAKYISAASATVFLAITHRLISAHFSPRLAILTLAFLMCNRIFWQFSYSGGTDMFAAVLALSAVYFADRKKLIYVAIAGVCAGLAFLTRYVFIVIPIAFLVTRMVLLFKRNRSSHAMAFAVYLLLFVVTIAPYGYLSFLEYGKPFKNKNYLNSAYELVFSKQEGITFDYPFLMNAEDREILFDEVYIQQDLVDSSFQVNGIGELWKNYAGDIVKGVVLNLFENTAYHAVFVVGWPLMAVLLLLCISFSPVIWQELKGGAIKNWILKYGGLYGPAVLYFLALLLVFHRHRFGLFLLPFYMAFIARIVSLLLKGKSKRFNVMVWLVLLLTCLVDASVYNWRLENHNKILAELTHFQPEKGEKVAALTPNVVYKNGAALVPFPYVNNADSLQSVLAKQHISYVYYGIIEKAWRPGLNDLFEDKLPGWLQPVLVREKTGLYKVVFNTQKPPE